MGDNVGSGNTNDVSAATAITSGQGGIIDVSGMSFDQLAVEIRDKDLGRALDYILASGQNGTGYHGFNNHI